MELTKIWDAYIWCGNFPVLRQNGEKTLEGSIPERKSSSPKIKGLMKAWKSPYFENICNFSHLNTFEILFPAIIYIKPDHVHRGAGESNAADMTGPLMNHVIAW